MILQNRLTFLLTSSLKNRCKLKKKNEQLGDQKVKNVFPKSSKIDIWTSIPQIGIFYLVRKQNFPKNQHFLLLINEHERVQFKGLRNNSFQKILCKY